MTLTRFYTAFLLLLFVGYVLVEYYRPKSVNWAPTFSNLDKIPFGTKASFELLKTTFPQQQIRSVRLPIYNHLNETKRPIKSSYLFVNQSFELDKIDLAHLLEYVYDGNQVFIAAEEFNKAMEDTLGFRVKFGYKTAFKKSVTVNFVNPQLRRPQHYQFEKGRTNQFFSLKDTVDVSKVRALGKNSRDSVNFLSIQFGKGTFYLHCIPQAFTNFYVLKPETADYAFKAFSYLPVATVYWDEYQKQGRIGEGSMFRFIYSQPPLEWAFYIAIVGILLFVFFEGKRRQRLIPIVAPPRNTSLEFVETVGNLYYQQRDHSNIAHKKVAYFLAQIRQQFYLQTNTLDNEFKEALAQKSGIDIQKINDLFVLVEQTLNLGYLSEHQLIQLNNQLEEFYQNAR